VSWAVKLGFYVFMAAKIRVNTARRLRGLYNLRVSAASRRAWAVLYLNLDKRHQTQLLDAFACGLQSPRNGATFGTAAFHPPFS
jgi:hypothetical protein